MANAKNTHFEDRNKIQMLICSASNARSFLDRSGSTLSIFRDWLELKLGDNIEASIFCEALDLLSGALNEAYTSLCEGINAFEEEERA